MSDHDSPNVPAPRDRRHAVREKAQEVHAQQTRARRMRRAIVGGVVVVAVVAIAIGVTWAIQSSQPKPVTLPENIDGDGFMVTSVAGVPVVAPLKTPTPTPTATKKATPSPSPSETAADSKVEIRVFVDFLSEGSKDFQLTNVQQLSTWITQDAANVTYYPVAMLTSKSNGTKYSLRAAGASACIATLEPDYFFAFTTALLRAQPELNTDGMDDSDIADVAIASGAKDPKAIRRCIEKETYVTWAKAATDRSLKAIPDTDNLSLTATPMILVNGSPYVGSLTDAKEFAQFVLTISSDAYYSNQSPTPTPTATPTKAPTKSPSPSPSATE